MGRRKRRGTRVPLLLLLVALSAFAAYVYAQRLEPSAPAATPPATGTLRVHYVDVGQGDGTIWEMPDGSLVVYDCGPPASDAEAAPMVRYLRETLERPAGSRIAALVSSHGHLDHIGGCEEILASYTVDNIYEAWYEGPDAPESYRRFLREAEAKAADEGARVHRLADMPVGSTIVPGATLLWPSAFAPGGWDAIAEASLVIRLQHGATSFCFQGDIEAGQEAMLAGRCDAYLVGHHGSRFASSADWLARMDPAIAVASFGENAYGHPHPDALCRVQQAGATVYTTHRSHGVVLASDGLRLQVVRGQAESADYCAGASYWP